MEKWSLLYSSRIPRPYKKLTMNKFIYFIINIERIIHNSNLAEDIATQYLNRYTASCPNDYDDIQLLDELLDKVIFSKEPETRA
jgi:hypothetical protein